MDVERALSALAEPSRLRIVELLADAPRPVGEVAAALGARQPQTTKHLQALAAAGLVIVQPLGRRRVVALRRDRIRELAAWLGGLGVDHPSEPALDAYRAAVDAEEARAAAGLPADRTVRLRRRLPAPPEVVWRAWTSARLVRRWWAPDHFEVADCTVRPRPGGVLRVVLREGDGAEHVAEGRFLELRRPERLRFEMAPLGPDATPLFTVVATVALAPRDGRTHLDLSLRITDVAPGAAPALAGVELGWRQTLHRLAAVLASDADPRFT